MVFSLNLWCVVCCNGGGHGGRGGRCGARESRGAAGVGAAAASPGPNHPRYGGKLPTIYHCNVM